MWFWYFYYWLLACFHIFLFLIAIKIITKVKLKVIHTLFFIPFWNHPSSTSQKHPKNVLKRTCEYQGVRNTSFSENFAFVLNRWSLSCYVFSDNLMEDVDVRAIKRAFHLQAFFWLGLKTSLYFQQRSISEGVTEALVLWIISSWHASIKRLPSSMQFLALCRFVI